jgi:2-keto-4-pentenoate hydratase/2-oxohepta-3-ene-1,7-dioic acid hydratase in catechol pathway
MRIIRYQYHATTSHGLLEGNVVVPIEGSIFETFNVSSQHIPLDEVTILSPVVPSKAVCVGLNYLDHAQEFNLQLPPEPILFLKPTSSVIGPEAPIVHPRQSKRVDFEAELAIVIGKTAKEVEESQVDEYILGYTCANDVTARDLQPQNGQWTMAKSFDTFCPLGPVITDEVDCDNLNVESRVNGVVKQHSNTRFLAFKPRFLVSYISKIMTLYPGDVILTGTPGGIAPMASGDIVEIEVEGIGILRNPNIRW